MRILAYLFIAFVFYYTLSFGKYNWDQGNKLAAAGAFLMGLLTLAVPALTIYFVG